MAVDVLICGAGPTGLMLAILLARENIKFRIIDENSGRAQESRAMAIQPRSMELFMSLGLANRFLERGIQAEGLSAYLKGKKLFDINFNDIGRFDTPFPYIYFLSQSITEEILENYLAELGVKVERSLKLDSFRDEADQVTATLKNDQHEISTLKVKYLIGCDGAKSQVRKTMGLSFSGGTYESEFLLADTKVSGELSESRVQVFLGDKHVGVYMPLRDAEFGRVITVGPKSSQAESNETLTTRSSATLDEIQEAFSEATSQQIELKDAKWVSRYRVHHRSVESMRKGRCFVAGDAAHIHSPAGGQGMNTGLQDAANLAWKLSLVIQQKAPASLLETYHLERWPVAQHLLKYTDRLFGFASSLNVTIKTFRNTLLPQVAKVFNYQKVRKYLFGFISQLNIHYHENEFILENIQGSNRNHSLRAGYRAPDAKLGERGSVLQLIQGYRFHVLVMSRNVISESAKQNFRENWLKQNFLGQGTANIHWIEDVYEQAALDSYQVEDQLVCLVRPDGYIAYMRNTL
jgi:2-polyprenyl-6-methoxyphenol hydroxylase-like FAD-dependent oxidoreductase